MFTTRSGRRHIVTGIDEWRKGVSTRFALTSSGQFRRLFEVAQAARL